MVSINTASVLAKVNSYMKSAEGKKRAVSVAEKYVEGNKAYTEAGSRVLTTNEMMKLARELAAMVGAEATESIGGPAGGSVASSVTSNLATLTPGDLSKTGPLNYVIDLSFSGNLSRPSLDPRYSGIDNIIALMNNGYSAPGAEYIGGYWHGVYIHGRTSRPALNFMQSAVDSFNAAYESLGVHAELNPIYG